MIRIGDIVNGRFLIQDVAPEGGQSIPYLATQLDAGTPIMLLEAKKPERKADHDLALARLERTGRLRIRHPRVLTPTEVFRDRKTWFSVVPYCEGPTLEALLASKGGKLNPGLVERIVDEVAEALTAVHDAGVVHRDIKPANIIIHPLRGAHVIDFGICRVPAEQTLTGSANVLGTLRYVAPEQVDDPTTVTSRADLFSLGAMQFRMLCGRTHIEGKSDEELLTQLRGPAVTRPRDVDPHIPELLDDVCMRLLERDQSRRLQSANEVRRMLGTAGLNPAERSDLCWSCNRAIAGEAAFCPNCGAAAARPQGLETRCLACGISTDDGQFCQGCGRPFGVTAHQLCFQRGAAGNVRFRIPQGIYVVGRNQICPRDNFVSSAQFSVACRNGIVEIEDCRSVNTTFLEDIPLLACRALAPNQVIHFAGHVAVYTQT